MKAINDRIPDYFRSEAFALLRLGIPMVATQLFIMGMSFLDTAMAGHYGAADLAGVALGGAVLWPVFMFMTGLTMAITPIVSQLRGAERIGDSGAVVRQGLWIALFTSLLTIAIIINAEPLYHWAGVDAAVVDVAMGYLYAVAWGMPGSMIYVVLRYTSEGLGHPRPPMIIAGSALALNAPLNYVLIFGKLGAPELGGVGCGWATAAVMWLELLLMSIVVRRPFFRVTGMSSRFSGPDPKEIWRIFKIGAPIGAMIFLEMVVYSVIGFLVGSIGVNALAAHSIAGNLNWLTYVIPMSLGSAASIRVGFHVGAGDIQASRNAATTAFLMSLGYAIAVSTLLLGLRQLLVSIYSNDAAVLEIAANLMIFVAVYQIVDDTQATMSGALRGYKDTRMPMIYSLVGYWIVAMPLGHALAKGWLGYAPIGVYGYWTGMTIGLFLVALCDGQRLWRTSRDPSRIERLATG
jgi:MATE family multidrug resistance protein